MLDMRFDQTCINQMVIHSWFSDARVQLSVHGYGVPDYLGPFLLLTPVYYIEGILVNCYPIIVMI